MPRLFIAAYTLRFFFSLFKFVRSPIILMSTSFELWWKYRYASKFIVSLLSCMSALSTTFYWLKGRVFKVDLMGWRMGMSSIKYINNRPLTDPFKICCKCLINYRVNRTLSTFQYIMICASRKAPIYFMTTICLTSYKTKFKIFAILLFYA